MIAAGQCLNFSCLFVLNFDFLFYLETVNVFPLSSQLTIKGIIYISSVRLSFHLSHFFRKGKRIACKPSNDASLFFGLNHACVKEQLVLVLSSVSRRCLLFAEVSNYMHFGKL